jgi:hypothetical protein
MAKLAVRPLIDVQGVNDYIEAQQLEMNLGDIADFYFQLVDMEKNLQQHGYSPPGLRYFPATGATMAVTFLNLNAAKQFVRTATQPFDDSSIWKVPLLATDPLAGTVSIKIVLTEGSTVRTIYGQAVILVKGFNQLC